MRRTLRLTKDTLAELSTDELSAVAGGAITAPALVCVATIEQCPLTGLYPTLPVLGCVRGILDDLTH